MIVLIMLRLTPRRFNPNDHLPAIIFGEEKTAIQLSCLLGGVPGLYSYHDLARGPLPMTLSFSSSAIQSNLFDFTAKEQTDNAIARSIEHADPIWKEVALSRLLSLCRSQHRFTVDDLCEALSHVEARTENTSALGGIMRHGAKKGWMRQTGEWELSKDPKKHSRALRVWESLIDAPTTRDRGFPVISGCISHDGAGEEHQNASWIPH